MKVIKRNGSEVIFDITKIIIAITKANESVEEADRLTPLQIQRLAESVELQCQKMFRPPTVEEIQDMVENHIMAHGAFEVAKHYITYRYTRSLVRRANTTDDKILSLLDGSAEGRRPELPVNPVTTAAQRDYIAGEVSRDLTWRLLLPREIVEAHEAGILHFHDADYYAQHMHSCGLINLEDMLQNGTVLNGAMIERPRSFATACTVAVQIAAHAARSQYGGMTMTLTHLAPFVAVSRQKLLSSVRGEFDGAGIFVDSEQVAAIAEKRLRSEIRRGVQAILYQSIALLPDRRTSPLTLFLCLGEARDQQERADLALLIEEMLLQRIRGVKDESGAWSSPAAPRLLYMLEEDNVREDAPYRYLTALAARCTARHGTPAYISRKLLQEYRSDGQDDACFPSMGGPAFLPPYADEDDRPLYYGRFQQGVVTLNLADAALSSGGNIQQFWKLLDERLELCRQALMCRHERLKGTLSDAAPLLWQHGACARLKKGQPIDRLLYGGYSTLSLGYAGLHECVRFMTGKNHTDPSAVPFALRIISAMNDACRVWTTRHNVAFTLYGPPLSCAARRLARCLQQRFGTVPGVTDQDALTAGCSLREGTAADAREKLEQEAQFQCLCSGGAASSARVSADPAAVLELLPFLYDHVIYTELSPLPASES